MTSSRTMWIYSLFTLTDGALRMLILLHAAEQGVTPVVLAGVFALYEIAGVVTNFYGGRLADRYGTFLSMRTGLGLQLLVLGSLALPTMMPPLWIVVIGQGLSGIAKDLVKIGAKSAQGSGAPKHTLFRNIAALTGTKNATKGLGFFVGGLLLSQIGARGAYSVLAACVAVAIVLLGQQPTRATAVQSAKKTRALLSPIPAVNRIAVARLLLFGAREIWLALAVPLWFATQPGWGFWQSGAVLAGYTIGYGAIQGITPRLLTNIGAPDGRITATVTALPVLVIACAWGAMHAWSNPWVIIACIGAFSVTFAVASSLHSYLIVAYADSAARSSDIGLYYSANALGRLGGLLVSGLSYAAGGMSATLVCTGMCLLGAVFVTRPLPAPDREIVIDNKE